MKEEHKQLIATMLGVEPEKLRLGADTLFYEDSSITLCSEEYQTQGRTHIIWVAVIEHRKAWGRGAASSYFATDAPRAALLAALDEVRQKPRIADETRLELEQMHARLMDEATFNDLASPRGQQ